MLVLSILVLAVIGPGFMFLPRGAAVEVTLQFPSTMEELRFADVTIEGKLVECIPAGAGTAITCTAQRSLQWWFGWCQEVSIEADWMYIQPDPSKGNLNVTVVAAATVLVCNGERLTVALEE